MYWRPNNRNCGMESEEEKKKLNDDLVVFMRKRSETEAPRYTARLKTYVDFKQKRRRAAAARRHTDYRHNQDSSVPKKKNAVEAKDKSADNLQTGATDDRVNKRRIGEKAHKPRSLSRSPHSAEPVDACCKRRRRRCRRRRRSCRRRSRRRRRRSCGRRRRRSRSRRRRRRSCRRRRRRRRCRR